MTVRFIIKSLTLPELDSKALNLLSLKKDYISLQLFPWDRRIGRSHTSTYKELFAKPKYGMQNLNAEDMSTLSGKYQLYIMLYF